LRNGFNYRYPKALIEDPWNFIKLVARFRVYSRFQCMSVIGLQRLDHHFNV